MEKACYHQGAVIKCLCNKNSRRVEVLALYRCTLCSPLMDWPYADLRLRYRLLIDLFYSSPLLEGICDFHTARLKLQNGVQYPQLDMETDA